MESDNIKLLPSRFQTPMKAAKQNNNLFDSKYHFVYSLFSEDFISFYR